MGLIINTAKGTNNINTNLLIRDMSSTVHLLKPAETPLMTLLKSKIGTETANAVKKEWMEDSLMSTWTAPAVAVADGNATSITVTTGTGSTIAVNDLLINTTTNETVLVTSVSGDVLTVVRGYGDAAKKAAMTTAQKLLILGNVNMQGAGSPTEKAKNPTINYNYTQIFRTPFSVTNTLEAVKMYSGSELERLHMLKGIEHARAIEQTLWMGKRNLDVSGAQPVGAMGGVAQFLDGTANMFTKAVGSATEDDLDAWAEQWFKYGSSTKVLICGGRMLNWIHKLAKTRLHLVQSDMDTKYGLSLTTVHTPYGDLKMMRHPLFTDGLYGHAFVLDLEMIDYAPLSGRDTKLKENIQNNDEDGRRDEYLTEATLKFVNPEKHGGVILT